jgi:predicted GNAT superfamily acetyltransferase
MIHVEPVSTDLSIAREQLAASLGIRMAVGWGPVAAPVLLINALQIAPGLDLGFVLVALDDAREVLGFARVGCTRRADTYWLHEVAVSPTSQNRGIGYALMCGVEEFCLERRASRVLFTYDPMLPQHSHLYLNKCGAVGQRFWPDLFGEGDLRRDDYIPEPRMMASWGLGDARRMATKELFSCAEAPVVTRATECREFTRFRVTLPERLPGISTSERRRHREAIAPIFLHALNELGCLAVGLVAENVEGRTNRFLCFVQSPV